ncbi:Sjoegren syndrome nuclear autoantigen 1 homolog [Cephus cinctus]|uniref:Sjoegren syndrome nuclear autoantigen 1 homolog n=1 Tax=Cephus cinctus TaxID=211228 RepID=A0AAJ7BSP9_CEPCN|nr:Sjoegren syndrome nuclear autoantigen 1 homolog [Cephus cinctus]XP_024939562.1 Sjoegren syndrome nuclear autoantigen 1 homolog [Cephus cinctus]
MASQFGVVMQNYNSDLMKCIDELKTTRTNLQVQIDSEEEEKKTLEKEVERMTHKINQLSESLTKKAAARNDYDRTIRETESAYTKLLESSQLLLNMVKREADCLEQALHATESNFEESPAF